MAILLQLEKRKEKREGRRRCCLWCGEKEEKKNERIDDGVGRLGEKIKEEKKQKSSAFGLILFWCNFLVFAELLNCD
jgi:hypothetical protein